MGAFLAPAAAKDERPAAGNAEFETAALAPSFGPDGDIALPQVLAIEDAVVYRAIFGLQEAGQWRAADREIKKLKDKRLLGHVLAQRYLHPTKYRSKYRELRDWLVLYADHPDARRIYRLALRRKPAAAPAPRAPVGSIFSGWIPKDESVAVYKSPKRLSKVQRKRVRQLKAAMRSRIRRGWPTGAKQLLEQAETIALFNQVEIDQARADISASYFYNGKDDEALAMADAATERSSFYVPQAHWSGGLAAWRSGRMDQAAAHFEALALAPGVSDWHRAAGAYWAGRVHLVTRNPEQVNRWLRIAAAYPRTFYGLLAHRALGLPIRFDWRVSELSPDDVARLSDHPSGARAMALLQVGERDRAEAELRRIHPDGPETARALAVLAVRAKLPWLSLKIGMSLEAIDGVPYDSAVFPVPLWAPAEGYRVDQALVFALMRQESQFNPRALSRAGARGLMQLMPNTASFIARDRSLRASRRYRLFEPALNISLAQKYLTHLLDHEQVEGNLLRLVAAYNGGPGNLAKWRRETEYADDPLLFIESLPARETRDFIERVLTNLWIYRHRLGQDTPSLDTIAAGDWPTYTSLDGAASAVASHVED